MGRTVRRLLYGAVFLFLGVNASFAALLVWMQTSLPTLEGTVPVNGATADVEIVRDGDGVPTIRARTPADAYFGLGYAHAQDRLWQMELTRRIGSGRLSELTGRILESAGEATLPFDRFLRTLGLRRLAEESFRRLPSEARAELEAYARGVNAFLKTRDGPLPPEFQLVRLEPEPWSPTDSLVWQRIMALQLSSNWFRELLRARMAKAGLTEEQIRDLFQPVDGLAAVPVSPDLAALDGLSERRLADAVRAIPVDLRPRMASNAWVVDGRHTKTGKPLLANDPHLGLTSPNLWYLARLEAPGWLRVGATVPGVPFLVVGHNGSVAWGLTTTNGDAQDVFVETLAPGNPDQYLTPDGPQAFEVQEEIILVGDRRTTHTVRSTRHGPVISDAWESAGELATDASVLALGSATLTDDDGTPEALWRMGGAASVDQFVESLKGFHAPQQNVFVADVDGGIAMVSAGRLPVRTSGDGLTPADGRSGAGDWTGWVPFDALPASIKPDSGIIIQANNKVVPRDPAYFISHEFAAPYRAQRIFDMLEATDKHDAAAFTAMQMDATSLAARQISRQLLAALGDGPFGDPAVKAAVSLLSAWSGEMDKTRPEPLIYSAWLAVSHSRIFGDELGDIMDDMRRVGAGPLLRALGRGDGAALDWCDDQETDAVETCRDVVSGSLSQALAELATTYGTDPAAWRWGDAHKARFEHRIFSRIPGLGALLTPEVATDGGDYTVNRGTSPLLNGENPYQHVHGAGLRVVFDLADLDRSVFSIALGQSGNPFSPYALTYLDAWAEGRYRTLGPTPDGTIGTLRLVAEN